MLAPTAADVRARLPATVDLAAVGYPAPTVAGAVDPLEYVVARARRVFERITGLTIATIEAADADLANPAIDGLTMLAANEGSEDRLETVADFDLIQSFAAGSYNEQRRDPGDPGRRITAWPWLNDILWLLMTDEKRAEWETALNPDKPNAPAFSVSEVDWYGGM